MAAATGRAVYRRARDIEREQGEGERVLPPHLAPPLQR